MDERLTPMLLLRSRLALPTQNALRATRDILNAVMRLKLKIKNVGYYG